MNIQRSLFGGMTANERRLGRFLRDGAGHPAPAGEGPTNDDAFDAAFAAAEAGTAPDAGGAAPAGEPGAGDPPADAGAAGGAAPASEPAAPAAEAPPASPESQPAGGDGGAPPTEEPPAASAGGEAAPAEPAPSADEIVKGLADLLKNPPAQAPAAPAAPAEPEQAPIYSAEEQAFLEEYRKTWPDAHRAGILERKAEYHDLMKFMFSEVVKYVNPHLETLAALQNSVFATELKGLMPEYNADLEKQVGAWIDTQPAYLQGAMKQVMQGGTTEEVHDLFQRYQASQGGTPPAPTAKSAPAPAPAAAPPKTELSDAAKQAAKALAPVSAERSSVPDGGIDPQDFDSAFSKYAAGMGT